MTDVKTADQELDLDWSFVTRLEQLNDGTSDLVGELLQLFLDLTPQRLAALDQALSQDAMKDVFYQAHTLKSGCANLGLRAMTELCHRIETSARDEKTSEAADSRKDFAELLRLWEIAKPIFTEAIILRKKGPKT